MFKSSNVNSLNVFKIFKTAKASFMIRIIIAISSVTVQLENFSKLGAKINKSSI